MAAAIALVLLISLLQPLNATNDATDDLQSGAVLLEDLPYRPHPLPTSLGAIAPEGEHYGERLEETAVGALVWSELPIRVYLHRDPSETWREAMTEVIQDWGEYLPLELVKDSELGDIVIWQRRPPPRRVGDDFRAAAARVSYDLYWRENRLGHRFEILISPTQGTEAARAALRHELGHALGIWGHSDRPTDVMYYSQVRHPPHLSPRDLRTLRYVYEQPTRLGWSVLRDSDEFLKTDSLAQIIKNVNSQETLQSAHGAGQTENCGSAPEGSQLSSVVWGSRP